MLKCYRWTSRMLCDPDTVGLYVQRAGGHFEPRADTVLFWVPERAEVVFVCAWPELERRPDLDYI
jgi:hypothetical protein